jgi:nitric oxide reductase NorD protein
MGFDEFLFGKISNYYRAKKVSKLQQLAQTVSLEEIRPRLTLIARALTMEDIEIFPAEREGGFKNNNFFLPTLFYGYENKRENEQFYIFRILYLCTQKKLDLNWASNDNFSDIEAQKRAMEVSPLILKELFNEFPFYEEFYLKLKVLFENQVKKNQLPDYSFIYGKYMLPGQENSQRKSGDNFVKPNQGIRKKDLVKTIIKARNSVESITSKQVDKKQQEDATIYHDLEKLRTADEFGGNWKDFDGDDEVEKHQEALKELKMQYTVRVDDDAHSVYQSEFVENTQIAEMDNFSSDAFFIFYDEWDFSNRKYKKDYCLVYPDQNLPGHPTYYGDTIRNFKTTLNSMRKTLVSLNNKYKQVTLQKQGDDFDIDAVTDFSVSVISGRTPSENMYIDKHKREKDLSILLLLDNSLSSDSYVMNNRVIDVEKQVSILFGEILHEFQVDFGIAAFHSKTRNHINFSTLKDFDEDWNKAKHRIGSLEPQGYTRIGAPLRHASALLKNRDTKNRWVVLLSDGKPNDYDRYEGKYGLNDIKQALREMKSDGIQTYALAIEKQAKYYLPLMFGHDHFQILSSPFELLQALIKLYERIRHHH